MQNYIFDFDGTLADTFSVIYQAWSHTCTEFDLQMPTEDKIKSMMGWHLVLIAQTISGQEHAAQIVISYKNNYDQLANSVKLFEGVKEVLIELQNRNKKLFVVSAKSSLALNQAIKNLDLENYFEEVIGAEDVTRIKPNPEAIELIIAKYNLNQEETIMIGDALVDIQIGQNSQVKTCGVTWGACNLEQIESFGANYTINQPNQILEL